MKHFKNSQQINCSTDHGSSYADRERDSLQVCFLHIPKMLNVSTFGNTTDIYAIVHLVPPACQHITVDQNHSSGDTAAKIWRLAVSGDTKTVSFTNPPRIKIHTGFKSGDRGGHRINASSSFPVRPIQHLWQVSIEIPSHVFVVSRRAVLLKYLIITVLRSAVTSASFLTCFTDL